MRDVMNPSPQVLPSSGSLGTALSLLGPGRDEHSQHLYPVLSDAAQYVGAVSHSRLLEWAQESANLERPLSSFALARPAVVCGDDTLRAAVQQMAVGEVTRLLVVSSADGSRLVGKVALGDVLRAHKRHLEEEHRRERILPWEYVLPAWLRNFRRGSPGAGLPLAVESMGPAAASASAGPAPSDGDAEA